MEEWSLIREFPGYSVSDCGRVRNDEQNRMMAICFNLGGTAHVGLTKNKKQHKRSVALLVARAFLRPAEDPRFDTPIHLDGDSRNNHAENLMWRPRWYAIRYQHQFTMAPQGFSVPIFETHTGEKFENSWEAATKYGLIDRDIMLAVINKTFVWPTYQFFKTVT